MAARSWSSKELINLCKWRRDQKWPTWSKFQEHQDKVQDFGSFVKLHPKQSLKAYYLALVLSFWGCLNIIYGFSLSSEYRSIPKGHERMSHNKFHSELLSPQKRREHWILAMGVYLLFGPKLLFSSLIFTKYCSVLFMCYATARSLILTMSSVKRRGKRCQFPQTLHQLNGFSLLLPWLHVHSSLPIIPSPLIICLHHHHPFLYPLLCALLRLPFVPGKTFLEHDRSRWLNEKLALLLRQGKWIRDVWYRINQREPSRKGQLKSICVHNISWRMRVLVW